VAGQADISPACPRTPSLLTFEVETSVDEGGGDQPLGLGRPINLVAEEVGMLPHPPHSPGRADFASSSSRESFAYSGVAVHNPDCW
jgi:hypothetical protein